MKKIMSLLLICTLSACYTSKRMSIKKIESQLDDFFTNANDLNINATRPVLYLQCANNSEKVNDNIFRSFLNDLTQNRNFKKLKIINVEWQSDTAFLTTQVYFNNNKPTVIYKADERTEVNDNQILIMDKRILWAKNAQTYFFVFPECSESRKIKILKK